MRAVHSVSGDRGGAIESGFSQSDAACCAWTGTGVLHGQEPVAALYAIANLYPASNHLVARAGSGINSVADLRGRKVSLDEPGSGTLVDVQLILAVWGLSEADITPEYLKLNQAADLMSDGHMDAFFFVGGFPAGAIAELATSRDITIVTLTGPEAGGVLKDYGFCAPNTIPAATCQGVDQDVATLAVGALWITGASQSEELIYEITSAVWNKNSRALPDAGHAKGKEIVPDHALDGVGISLHPGAERFCREAGPEIPAAE
nr:TAXI family TRAP transporter solute-binding subunit [Pseudomonas sp. GX19020]